MAPTQTGTQNVDKYVASFSGVAHERVTQVRNLIRQAIPEAEERMSYGMPAYFINKRVVIYFSGYAHHIGLYPGRVATGDLAALLGPYLTGKSTARFPHDQPMPTDIISQLIDLRKNEVVTGK